MSVRIMSVVWGIPMTPTQKLVLLALADNCNDMGECYPSILTICEKSGLSERGVQGAISEMEKMGLVNRFMRKGRSTLYTITPAGYAPPQEVHPAPRAPAPAPDAPPPPQEVHPTPAPRAPITVNEPSIEPSLNRHVVAGAKKSKGTRIPDDWVLSKKLGEWAHAEKPHWSIDKIRSEAEAFKDYWLSVAGARGIKQDWDATWRNWVRRSNDAPMAGQTGGGYVSVNKQAALEQRNAEAARQALEMM